MAEEEFLESTIVEERQELMVDPTSTKPNKKPTMRTSHFLKPSLSSYSMSPPPPLPLPKIQSFSNSSRPNVLFLCSSTPLEGWQTWFENLAATHEPAWRKAGIFDAIKCSTYHILKDPNVIFSLVEKWCPETNTYVFPWGEATITLEDVFVLGGFSPLGVSVLNPCSSLGGNVKQVEYKLMKVYTDLLKINRHLSHLRWQEQFVGCGIEIEEAAFLALWLGRHVFPTKRKYIFPHSVLPMAAMLSFGAKFAFGPAILASIYGELTLLKNTIAGGVSGDFSSRCPLKLTSALHLVQVWAWERFPILGPIPRVINCRETRLARWDNHLRKLYDIDSARETFRWHPFAESLENWSLPRFYADSGTWVIVDYDEEWRVFARFLMVCELEGLDSVLDYNPHRVALQIGFDQDIPEFIDRLKSSCKIAWLGYKRNLKGLRLYLPPRLHEGEVTYRYSKWWASRLNLPKRTLVDCSRKKKTWKKLKKTSEICDKSNNFATFDIYGISICGNPMENSPPLQVELDTSMENVEDNEVRKSNGSSMGESSKYYHNNNSHHKAVNRAEPVIDAAVNRRLGEFSNSSEGTTSQINSLSGAVKLVAHDIENLCSPLGDINVNKDCGVANSRCSSLPCNDGMNLANELRHVMEENLNERDNAKEHNKEQILIEQDVKMNKHSESLMVDEFRSETATGCKGRLIRVACEVNVLDPILEEHEQDEALCMNHANIPVDGEVDLTNDEDSCDYNPIEALCLELESRISKLEGEISALVAANVLSTKG